MRDTSWCGEQPLPIVILLMAFYNDKIEANVEGAKPREVPQAAFVITRHPVKMLCLFLHKLICSPNELFYVTATGLRNRSKFIAIEIILCDFILFFFHRF